MVQRGIRIPLWFLEPCTYASREQTFGLCPCCAIITGLTINATLHTVCSDERQYFYNTSLEH